MTSRSRYAGSLEGMHCIAEDRILEQRFERLPVDDIGRATQQFSDIEFDPNVFEKPDRLLRIKIDQYIDIAASACVASRH